MPKLPRIPTIAGSCAAASLAALGAVACSTEDARTIASSASSIASSVGSAASSAATSAGSVASSAAISAGSAASSAASSVAGSASSAVSSVVAAPRTTVTGPPGVGAVTLDGAVAEKYQSLGGEPVLGAPTAPPQKIGDGTVQAFANGTIFASPSTQAHLVQGEILRVYTARGGPASPLGFPSADQTQTGGGPNATGGGWIGEFQHGSITWLNQGDGTFKDTVIPK